MSFQYKLIISLVICIAGVSLKSIATNKIENIDVVLIRETTTIGMHAPKGYFLDRTSAEGMGICGFYLNTGKSFHTSPTLIYARISAPGIAGEKGVESLVKEVSNSYKSQSPTFKLEKKPEYKSKSNLKYTIRYFMNGPPPNNFEAGAYLQRDKAVMLVIYSAKTEKEFSAFLPAFYETLDRIAPYSTQLPMLTGNCLYPKTEEKK